MGVVDERTCECVDRDGAGFLHGLRVIEIGEELGEYCGKLLAGLGADVVRVEPPDGETTRRIGPFYKDVPDPDRSLYFWHYNFGKRGVVLDLDEEKGRADFAALAQAADVIIDSRSRTYLADRGLGYEQLARSNPALIHARISAFGDTGPWADYRGSDLVHLALGGVMMNCGYDPDPSGFYDTPPIAPAMWQAYQIAGEMTAMSILAALNHRLVGGRGQQLSTSVHEAVSKNTETDAPDWVFLRQTHKRLTCRHSTVAATGPALSMTKDGRYMLPYRTYLKGRVSAWDMTVELLKDFGMQAELEDPVFATEHRDTEVATDRIAQRTDALVARLPFDRDIWRDAQRHGLPWSPVRKPEENVADEHWQLRESFFEVHHPELDETFVYNGAKWVSEEVAWARGPRAPMIGEHTDEVLKEWQTTSVAHGKVYTSSRDGQPAVLSKRGKPFALSGVRVVDLSWMLASAGAGRYLSAMGADVIKVEHESRWDGMRFGLGVAPPGNREERDRATEALPIPPYGTNPNRCGNFMEINSGKRGISLNLKHPRGRAILEDLIRDADMVIEGFSPGTLVGMGFGYERLKELNPAIVYVQQSGFGEHGTYGRARSYGPTAQAMTGISDMSGLPEPYPPAGIGYSYLDWFGAYNMAVAMLSALYRRNITGEGCHIDASQGDTGLYLTGTAVLDHSVNGRRWARYGNRSPYKSAAPHGAYRTAGEDRWIAIAAFTDEQWRSLAEVLGVESSTTDPRFADLASRSAHQDELDALIERSTRDQDGYALMDRLQQAGVPAGVCQSAEDRYEVDPQLRHLEWLVELTQPEIGTWPVKEHPVRFSETPAYMGGFLDRMGPSYGEDTDAVLGELLGLDAEEIAELRASKAI